MAQARHLIIVNPQACHGEAEQLGPVIEALLANLPHDTATTNAPGHATEIAAGAADYDVVVASGGDGTVHEVLNGLMRIDADRRPALAVLPTGSGNDTCRTLGVPLDLTAAAALLSTGEQRRYDVGACNGIFFNNSFAAGLDAKVTAKAVEYKVTKRRSGLWLYLTALLHVLFNDLGAFKLDIAFDGEPAALYDTLIVAITNGPTYGGGFKITPGADATDGVFEVCMIDPLGLGQALWRLPFVIAGKHTKMPVVHMSRHTSAVIDSPVPLPAQIDGEVLFERRYDVTMLPGAIECVVPVRA
ncbi:MAG TPA: diacylglycerol kinase family protein [Coriobacteriia bacterium]